LFIPIKGRINKRSEVILNLNKNQIKMTF